MRVFIISCAVLFILVFIAAAIGFSSTAFGDNSAMSSKDWISWISRNTSSDKWVKIYGTYYTRTITLLETSQEAGYITEYWQVTVKYESGYDIWKAKIIYDSEYQDKSIPKKAIKTLRSDAQYFIEKNKATV